MAFPEANIYAFAQAAYPAWMLETGVIGFVVPGKTPVVLATANGQDYGASLAMKDIPSPVLVFALGWASNYPNFHRYPY